MTAAPSADRPIRRLLTLARPGWARLGLAVAAGAAAAGAGVALTACSAWLISRAAEHPPVLSLMVAIVAVRAFGLSRGVLRYAERLAGHDAALRVLAELRTRVYARLTRLVPAAATDLRDGDLVARFVADVDAALDVIVRALVPSAISAVIAAASVTVLASLLPAAGAVLLIALSVVALGVPVIHDRIAGRAERQAIGIRGRMSAQTVTLFRQLPDVIAADATTGRLAQLAATGTELRAAARTRAVAAGTAGALTAAATGAAVLAALVLAGHATMRPVFVAVVVLTPLAVFDALSGLPAATAALRSGRASLRRVFEVLDRAEPTPDPAEPAASPRAPFHLRMRDVVAAWPGGPTVLTDVSLDLAPGSRTVLVGPSGSGKSTFAALAARLLDPVAGTVDINGIDLRDLTGDQVRAIVGYVDDRAYLFDSTIAANLRVGKPGASDAELHDALAAAHLGRFVAGLPRGLDTPVGEHGAKLSGGQRRRLALARALLADPPILILDEPAEHLDDATAAELTRNLLAAPGDRTVVVITHRPVDGLRVDQEIRVAQGTVTRPVQIGTSAPTAGAASGPR